MAKNPAFQYYPGDWSRDMEEHPLEIEGAWIRICNKLWWCEEQGKAEKTLIQWSRILRVSVDETMRILSYLKDEKIGDVFWHVTNRNKNILKNNEKVTVICRRMHRAWKVRESNRLRQEKFRKMKAEKAGHGNSHKNVVPSRARSSSSSSSDNAKALSSLSVSKDTLVKTSVSTPAKKTPIKKLIELYHKHCPSLPKVRKYPLSDASTKQVRKRWKEHGKIEWWIDYYKSVEASDFLTGRIESGRGAFVADFHWLIRPTNMEKIINGRYTNRGGAKTRKKILHRCPDCSDDKGVVVAKGYYSECPKCHSRRVPVDG